MHNDKKENCYYDKNNYQIVVMKNDMGDIEGADSFGRGEE